MNKDSREKIYYICKYTPIEIIKAFGDEAIPLSYECESFEKAEGYIHPNVCGFGKSIIEAVLKLGIKKLVLCSCCDTIKSVYDVLLDMGCMEFLYMIDLAHCGESCSRVSMAKSIEDFTTAYSEYKKATLDNDRVLESFEESKPEPGRYICLLGARVDKNLYNIINDAMPYPVRNYTCLNNRDVMVDFSNGYDPGEYAGLLLAQTPCMRMQEEVHRRSWLYNDPDIVGIIYHTMKFCDFYGFEYVGLKDNSGIPLLKIETDYTLSAFGQLSTRLFAFAEILDKGNTDKKEKNMNDKALSGYYAGIDSGSTSTDVVIMDEKKSIISEIIIPTGAGAAISSNKALDMALEKSGIKREEIIGLVSTGYGRDAIDNKDKSITEITCHAKGARYLNNNVRTVIDIGGQDSKVITMADDGTVENFVMNDKCAAGTGRFLEMMANTLQIDLNNMANRGKTHKEDITISSMCTVFAESEVVSLIAANKDLDDIIYALNKSVANKTISLVKRAGGEKTYMMTGGVSKNEGLVLALNEKLDDKLIVDSRAQLCGAIGAALYAMEI